MLTMRYSWSHSYKSPWENFWELLVHYFYGPVAPPDAQLTVSKHYGQSNGRNITNDTLLTKWPDSY